MNNVVDREKFINLRSSGKNQTYTFALLTCSSLVIKMLCFPCSSELSIILNSIVKSETDGRCVFVRKFLSVCSLWIASAQWYVNDRNTVRKVVKVCSKECSFT